MEHARVQDFSFGSGFCAGSFRVQARRILYCGDHRHGRAGTDGDRGGKRPEQAGREWGTAFKDGNVLKGL